MHAVIDLNATYKVDLSGGQRRLKEAVLYVAQQCQELPHFDLVKLYKILWRADFRSYYERAQPVTGRQYQRLPFGPAPVEALPVLGELGRERLVEFQISQSDDIEETRIIPKGVPMMRLFSAEDLEYLNESILHYRDMTGRETSDASHGIAWRTRFDGDPIPYQAAYFDDRPLDDEALEKLGRIGALRGWQSQ